MHDVHVLHLPLYLYSGSASGCGSCCGSGSASGSVSCSATKWLIQWQVDYSTTGTEGSIHYFFVRIAFKWWFVATHKRGVRVSADGV